MGINKQCLSMIMATAAILMSSYSQECFSQKRSSINPSINKLLHNIGWRKDVTNQDELYDVNNPKNERLTSNLNGRELISVLPNSYCSVGDFGKKTRRGMMTFKVDARLQKGSSSSFNAANNIYVEIAGNKYYALPSSNVLLSVGKNVKGEINIPIGKTIKKDRIAILNIQIGKDLHKFVLIGKTKEKVQDLALVPYNPIWHISPVEKIKNDIVKNEQKEEVKKAVKQAEDITNKIKVDLQNILLNLLAELKANNKLTDNTKVDVNAEVMPEIKASGSMEYNMKIRYDVQVINEHLKKLKIDHSTEDWAAGKYRLKDSQAALQTAGIIKSTIESKLEEYIMPGTQVTVKIIGGTDASTFKNKVTYNGDFGEIRNAECFVNGGFSYITVTKESGISTNEQLAYLRTLDIRDFMKKYIGAFRVANVSYEHFAEVADKVGSKYRRVAVEVTVHNAFQKKYPELSSFKENVYERTSEVDTNIPITNNKINAVAVIIGNTDYKVATGKQGTTKVGPVNYAVNDATTMRDYLTKVIGVPSDNSLGEG